MQADFQLVVADGSHGLHIRYLQGQSETGYAKLELDSQCRQFTWHEFYPMDKICMPPRRGYGTLAHVTTVKALQYLFGDDYLVSHMGKVSYPRECQLYKMGIQIGELMSLEDYCWNSLVYAASKGFQIGQTCCVEDREGNYLFTFPCSAQRSGLINCNLCPIFQLKENCTFGSLSHENELRQILMDRAPVDRFSDRKNGENPDQRHVLFEDDTGQIQFMCITLHGDGGETVHAVYPNNQ